MRKLRRFVNALEVHISVLFLSSINFLGYMYLIAFTIAVNFHPTIEAEFPFLSSLAAFVFFVQILLLAPMIIVYLYVYVRREETLRRNKGMKLTLLGMLFVMNLYTVWSILRIIQSLATW